MANPTGPSPSDAAMTVLIYVDTNKQVGDPNHLKVFATRTPRKSSSRKTIPLSKIRSSDEHGLELIPPKGVACGLPVFKPPSPNRKRAAPATSSQSAGAVSHSEAGKFAARSKKRPQLMPLRGLSLRKRVNRPSRIYSDCCSTNALA